MIYSTATTIHAARLAILLPFLVHPAGVEPTLTASSGNIDTLSIFPACFNVLLLVGFMVRPCAGNLAKNPRSAMSGIIDSSVDLIRSKSGYTRLTVSYVIDKGSEDFDLKIRHSLGIEVDSNTSMPSGCIIKIQTHVPEEGLEPPTPASVVLCSNPLSYTGLL